MSDLRVGALSHIGLVRRENQDRMSHFTCPFGEVFIVADGMGGHKGGSQAASMVVDGFERYLCQPPPRLSLRAVLTGASAHVNVGVCAAATSGDPRTDHMGSTAVILVVSGQEVLVGHLGDSRAYLWRNGRLIRLTRDHTWVQQLVDQDLLTEEEARNHPEASVLAHAFGRESELSIELSPGLAIRPGDVILLCSDGLCGYLTDDEITAVLARGGAPEQAVGDLVEAALATGGHDNVTVQLVAFAKRPRRNLRRLLSRGGQLLPLPQRATEHPTASEPLPSPAAETNAVLSKPEPPPSPVAPPDLETPEMIPTQPALPLLPAQTPVASPAPPRRRRVASPLVVVAALAGAVALGLGLWHFLQPAAPPFTTPSTAPTAEPTPSPSPAAEPTGTPDGSAPTAVSSSPTLTPTPALTPVPALGSSSPTGEAP